MTEDLQMISLFFSDFLYVSRFFFVSLHPKIRCPARVAVL
nr:MAG TPA: hypothetical protein [Caudoviricetes sp.]